MVGETIAIDMNNHPTITTTTVDRANRLATTIVNHPENPDDDANGAADEESVARNGLLQYRRSTSDLTVSYGYDGIGRQNTVTDSRGNTTTTVYHTSTGSGALAGAVHYVQDQAGHKTTFGYDPVTGRQAWIKNAADQYQYFAYTDEGRLWRTWGDTTYPVEYVYDDYGRRTEMHTYRGGSGWDQSDWPGTGQSQGSPGTADVTTWVYEEAAGLLTEKQYADHTVQNPRNVEYTYTSAGRMLTRKWSRTSGGNRVTATYGHDADTGDLLSVSYNDGTPDVTYTYNRLGRQETVTDAVGTQTFTYRSSDLQLETEDIDGSSGGLYSKLITRKYETAGTGTLAGRPAGFMIGDSPDPDADYDLTYAYDTAGRLETIAGTGLPAGGVVYERLKNGGGAVVSERIGKLSHKDGSGATVVSARWTYEANRDLIASLENHIDSVPVMLSSVEHEYDDLGRREYAWRPGHPQSQPPEPISVLIRLAAAGPVAPVVEDAVQQRAGGQRG